MTTRRAFIKQVAGATVAACFGVAIGSSLQGCSSVNKIQSKVINNQIEVSKADFLDSKYLIINNIELDAPIYLVKQNENTYNAFLMLCTHVACELKPTGTFMTCPCHGSEFSNTGKVLKGPANKALIQYKVNNLNKTIIIELNTQID